ncbi:MAG TPA: aminodeoxychorismate synthase component I, partial [Caulobacteraceae bacterium]|nr:aminodeoxychorismate synthase component I [Caulobacteraceae bacterium]
MNGLDVIALPWREPAEALAAFADEPFALGLLSDGSAERGRWSYLARRPDRTCVLQHGEEPAAALRTMLGPPSPAEAPCPFAGGVVGLAAYELGARFEGLDLARCGRWPDLVLARYPALLAFDHARRGVLAIGRGEHAARLARLAARWLQAPPVA